MPPKPASGAMGTPWIPMMGEARGVPPMVGVERSFRGRFFQRYKNRDRFVDFDPEAHRRAREEEWWSVGARDAWCASSSR